MKVLYDEIKSLLPNGSNGMKSWNQSPCWPPDLFAVSAFIIKKYDAYTKISMSNNYGINIDNSDHKRLVDQGKAWKNLQTANESDPWVAIHQKEIDALWKNLINLSKKVSIYHHHAADEETITSISKEALKLLIVSDEACEGLGWFNMEDENNGNFSWVEAIYSQLYYGVTGDDSNINNFFPKYKIPGNIVLTSYKGEELENLELTEKHISSICLQVPVNAVCVQPKTKVPQVGSTLRSLSQYLSLLPSRERVSVNWRVIGQSEPSYKEKLNILAVPFPYEIEGRSVAGKKSSSEYNVGYFSINHLQKKDADFSYKFSKFIKSLLLSAKKHVEKIDFILLPELSLDLETFTKLCDSLQDDHDMGVEAVIAGIEEEDSESGKAINCSSVYFKEAKTKSGVQGYFQKKHHRWKLNGSQIKNYSLTDSLDPNFTWWEDIRIDKREVNFYSFRKNTFFTTLICEDLARVDPCQEIIRSVGPSIVFALLMDGPQMQGRWPERYAMGLSDDPGSSIFSFTSLALIKRSNQKFGTNNRVIGMWRDQEEGTQEIHLPEEHHAVVLTLVKKSSQQLTLDGRISNNDSGDIWSYAGITPLKDEDKTFNL